MFPRLAERRRNLGNQLSGGEQQMLAVGRALVSTRASSCSTSRSKVSRRSSSRSCWRRSSASSARKASRPSWSNRTPRKFSAYRPRRLLERGVVVHRGRQRSAGGDRGGSRKIIPASPIATGCGGQGESHLEELAQPPLEEMARHGISGSSRGSRSDEVSAARFCTDSRFAASRPLREQIFLQRERLALDSRAVTLAPASGVVSSNQLRGGGRPHRLVLRRRHVVAHRLVVDVDDLGRRQQQLDAGARRDRADRHSRSGRGRDGRARARGSRRTRDCRRYRARAPRDAFPARCSRSDGSAGPSAAETPCRAGCPCGE